MDSIQESNRSKILTDKVKTVLMSYEIQMISA